MALIPGFFARQSKDQKDFLGCDQKRVVLPKYVAFKGENGYYLCVRQIKGHPYLLLAADNIGDRTAHFETFVTPDGNVRIKSISSNSFLRRNCSDWIWSDSTDTSNNNKDTLFRPVKVDRRTIALLNLGNNQFCKRYTDCGITSGFSAKTPCVDMFAKLTVEEPTVNATCNPDNSMSTVVLPKYVAFKGENDQYLCVRQTQGHPYLLFAANDICDPTARFETFATPDGNVRIKHVSSNKFLRRSCSDWIWSDSNDTCNNNKDTLFRPVKVDDCTIALLNLGNNQFCKRYTDCGITSGFSAKVRSVDRFAKLRVEKNPASNFSEQPINTLPWQPIINFPEQPINNLPWQPISFPEQPINNLPWQPISFPQQPINNFPWQPINNFPQQPINNLPW